MLIEYLPEIGVTEKKSHSSSLDLKHAELVRAHFRTLAEKGIRPPTKRPHTTPQPIRSSLARTAPLPSPTTPVGAPAQTDEPTREQLLRRIAQLQAQLVELEIRRAIPRGKREKRRRHKKKQPVVLCQGGLPSLGKGR